MQCRIFVKFLIFLCRAYLHKKKNIILKCFIILIHLQENPVQSVNLILYKSHTDTQ